MVRTEEPQLWAIVVTYRRPAELQTMLEAAQRQTRPPDHVIVVDNGSDRLVREVTDSARATYLDATDNLGPAGGVALGMEYVLERAGSEDWVLSLDDDDPPPADDIVEALWAYGQRRLAADPLTAGVGFHGADYDARRGVFRRYEDTELRGDLLVSVVAGGSLPMYRVATLRRIGVFQSSLFFGFEEGEFGLRIQEAGLHLYVNGESALRARRLWGQAGRSSREVHTPPSKAAWRRYYSVRNSTLLAWRYAGRVAPLYTAFGGAVKGTMALLSRRRPIDEVLLPMRGAVDGLLRRSGRTINPAASFK